jgi:hypothetical protein
MLQWVVWLVGDVAILTDPLRSIPADCIRHVSAGLHNQLLVQLLQFVAALCVASSGKKCLSAMPVFHSSNAGLDGVSCTLQVLGSSC